MARTVTAIFDGEVFRPTERVDLPPNSEHRLIIDEAAHENQIEGSAPGDHVAIEEEETSDDDERYPLRKFLKYTINTGLGDFAEQHDHHLYGTPKR